MIDLENNNNPSGDHYAIRNAGYHVTHHPLGGVERAGVGAGAYGKGMTKKRRYLPSGFPFVTCWDCLARSCWTIILSCCPRPLGSEDGQMTKLVYAVENGVQFSLNYFAAE